MAIPKTQYKKIQFSTEFNYQRQVISGTRSQALAAWNIRTITISHGLGYVPFFRLYVKMPSGKTYIAAAGASLYDGGFQVEEFYADTNNLYITVSESSGSASGTVNFYYKIYEERVNA